MTHTAYFTGLDLGQSQDPSALVVVEQTSRTDERAHSYAVRHLHRWPLGTSYPAIVEDLEEMFTSRHELVNTTLIVDATGVGKAVIDMVRKSSIRAYMKSFTITAGFTPGEGTVPKIDLVGAVQAALQSRRLKIADELPLAETLTKEMETFRAKVTPDQNETFASWREREHDDLLLALALAVWYGDRYPGNSSGCYSKTPPRRPGIDRVTGLSESIWR